MPGRTAKRIQEEDEVVLAKDAAKQFRRLWHASQVFKEKLEDAWDDLFGKHYPGKFPQ